MRLISKEVRNACLFVLSKIMIHSNFKVFRNIFKMLFFYFLDELGGINSAQYKQLSESIAFENQQQVEYLLEQIPMPEGWEKARTNKGEPYFINHTTKSTYWEDPRLGKRSGILSSRTCILS